MWIKRSFYERILNEKKEIIKTCSLLVCQVADLERKLEKFERKRGDDGKFVKK